MSLDDSRSYNSTPPAWVTHTPDFTKNPFPIASEAFAADNPPPPQPSSASVYQQIPRDASATTSYQRQLTNSGLPDLMPIMFPSEDPFAYPMQPMSTLEADHFSRDQGPASSFGQYTFGSAPQTSTLASPVDTPTGSMGLSSGLENFNLSTFPNGPMSNLRQQQSNQQQSGHHHSQSHGSVTNGVNAGEDTHESPDMVSIPDHNFVFQSYSFPQSIPPTGQQQQQQMAPTSTQSFVDGGADHNPLMASGFDMNSISLDDIFGNAASRPQGSEATEDWIQWMP